jgi:hypothetical protein
MVEAKIRIAARPFRDCIFQELFDPFVLGRVNDNVLADQMDASSHDEVHLLVWKEYLRRRDL